MILVDTNVVSEFMRPEPDPQVMSWAFSVPVHDMVVSVVTVQEVLGGIARLPQGRRRDRLDHEWRALVGDVTGQVVDYDREAAVCTADVLDRAQRAGRPMTLADAQIAGICLSRGLTLATRNVADFESVGGLDVVNPFERP